MSAERPWHRNWVVNRAYDWGNVTNGKMPLRGRAPMKDYPKVPEGFDVVAFDLDGTLAAKTWPSTEIGYLLPGAMDYILHYSDAGYEVRIWTARPASHYPRIWAWLREHGLESVIYNVTDVKNPDVGLFFDDHAVYPPWL